MPRHKCAAIKADGTRCQSFASPDTGLCAAHDPDRRDAQRAASRRGGEARANARRAARQWATIGEQVQTGDLASILKACMIAVKEGSMTPGEANAIAALAKSTVALELDLELERRIRALEDAAGLAQAPAPLRRVK